MHSHRTRSLRIPIVVAVLAACALAGAVHKRANAETTVTAVYFDETLAPHGSWVEDPVYGRVWRPHHASADWRPYAYGSWVYTREYGWIWVSDEPYGWVVYHYGRWVWTDRWGWVWVAGYDWAPAWVEWCYGGGYVGWAPMPPDPTWQGAYYYGSYDCAAPVYYSRAVFVSETYYGRSDQSSHIEPSSRNAAAARATVNVTSYSRTRGGIANRSIDVKKLSAATGRTINAVSVVQANAPVAPGAGAAGQLRIFRPLIADAQLPELQAPKALQLDQEPDVGAPVTPSLSSSFETPDRILRPLTPEAGTLSPPLAAPGAGSLSVPGIGAGTVPGAGAVGVGSVRGVLGR